MKKIKLIIHREFITKIRNKSFIIMTFLSPVIAIAMIIMVVFLMKKNNEKIKKIAYIDNSGFFTKNDFKNTKSIIFLNCTNNGLNETKNKVEKGNYYGVLFIPKINSLEILANSIDFFSKESPGINVIDKLENNINKKLRHLKMKSLNINSKKIEQSRITSNIKMFDLTGEKSSKLINGLKIGIGTIAGYLLMIFVIVYGQSVMRSVIEEKTSRVIEVIVSSVKPFQLMMGKIIGNALAGLLQFCIWGILLLLINIILSYFLGIDMINVNNPQNIIEQTESSKIIATNEITNIVKEIIQLPLLKIFLLFIFYFLSGYLLYSSLYAAIGSAVNNESDSQQFMAPIILPLVLAMYVGFATVINDPHGPISILFSYIPFTSPIVMLMRVPFGVPWWGIFISMLLLILTFLFIVWLASKIYKVGILSYGKKPSYKDLWKWIRYSN